MNIKDLGETHAGFFQDILESVTNKSRKKIGDIFLEYKERFLKYGDYCAQLPRAQETLDQLMTRDEAVREEVARCEINANEGKFRLRDLLAVPMQRVLKYHLLLRELTDNTASTHEEFRGVSQAYEAMLDVSDYINEVKRDSEQLHIIREIQNSITDWNMPPDVELKDYGRLRKDSELKVQGHDTGDKDRGKTKVRYVFVFDKVMLMCKSARGDHYSYKDSLKMAEFKVQDVPAPPQQQQSTATRTLNRIRASESRWAHSFLLVHVENTVAYTMFARTEEDKKKWMAALLEARGNVLPPQRLTSTHEALMFTFDRPTSCEYCHRLLKGLFYQGYRCEKCGRAMHKECIALLAKCGRSAPPALPPRPPSMLPTSTLSNRFSSISLDMDSSLMLERQSSLASVVSLPPGPPLISNGATAASHDYINTKMEKHSWYVGEMERESANTKLSAYPKGTFLVRERVQKGECVGHALSLKTQDDVKHMKICACAPSPEDNVGVKDATATMFYYLSDTRKFRSVVELVTWFMGHSLKEAFSGLDTHLQFPLGELSIVEAQYDFSPKPTDKNMLPLRVGERVTVVDKLGGDQGWWKAFSANNQVGYIPKDFVEEVVGEEKSAAEGEVVAADTSEDRTDGGSLIDHQLSVSSASAQETERETEEAVAVAEKAEA